MNSAAVLSRLRRFEGAIPWMYRDSSPDGYVTAGIGQLIPSISYALTLPWKVNDTAATPDEITRDFNTVKAALGGRMATYYAAMTQCRLDGPDMDALCLQTIQGKAEELNHALPRWTTYPEVVQEAVMDMAYNLGARRFVGGMYPKMLLALGQSNWNVAAGESSRNGISKERNQEIAALIRSAIGVTGTP